MTNLFQALVRTNLQKELYTTRVTDSADNVYTKSDYYFFIDQDLDKPTVDIISPSDGQNLGGPVLISGTAFDDDAIHHVEVQMDVNGDGDFTDNIDFWDGISSTPDGDTTDLFENESSWYTITGTSLWTLEINNYGELYETETGHNGDITMRIRAVDTKDGGLTPDLTGDIVTLSIHLDDTIPRVQQLSHSSGDYVKAVFTLTGHILDDTTVQNVLISYDGGINYSTVPGSALTPYADPDYDHYTLSLDIDTQTINSGSFAGSSGILYFRIKVVDNANYQNITSINLNVDNETPAGSLSMTAEELSDIHGGASRIQGTAEDGSGSVNGIRSVEIYFTNTADDLMYNLTGGTDETGTLDTKAFDNETDVYPPVDANDPTVKAAYAIMIDDHNEVGNDSPPNGDQDGYNESITISGLTYNWFVDFDSFEIPDGQLKMHFVVFDNAENAVHYEQTIFVKNHKPSVTDTIIGTDFNYSGTIGDYTGEAYSYSSGTAYIRNLISLAITASDSGGSNPGIAAYNFYFDGGSGPVLLQSGLSNTYQPANLDDFSNGDAGDLYAVVTDNDGIAVTSDPVYISVKKGTGDPPEIYFDEFTTSHVHADGGHIELAADSSDSDPDLSGTVTVTGSVSDDLRVTSVNMVIDNYDAGSGNGAVDTGDPANDTNVHTVASWDSGSNIVTSDVGTAFEITNQQISLDSHGFDFSYTFNTADIIGAAQNDVNIRFTANDGGSDAHAYYDGGTPATYIPVDVVPYITGLTRTGAGVPPIQRSKYGKYQLPMNETNLEINGYNLDARSTNPGSGNSEWIRLYDSSGTNFENLAYINGGVAVDFTSVTVDLDGAVNYSGKLELSVNGVQAINNTNADVSYNAEDLLVPTRWWDDRYIQVWNTGNDFQGSSDAERPAMTIDDNGLEYASFANYNTSDLYIANNTQNGTIFGIYDPPEWSDVYVRGDGSDLFDDTSYDFYTVYLGNYYDGVSDWGELRFASFQDWGDVTQLDELENVLYQYQNPRITVDADATVPTDYNIYISYYDNLAKALKFVQLLDDNTGGGQGVSIETANYIMNGGSGSVSNDWGKWSAIATDQNGCPVVSFYDTDTQQIRLYRATDDIPAQNEWGTVQNVTAASSFVGEYLSMRIDGAGNVYISAYKNSTGDLMYYYAPATNVGTDYSFTQVLVDEQDSVGAWSDISLTDNGSGYTPYIAYANSSQTGTQLGLKVSYYDPGHSDWEYLTVPVPNSVDSQRISIESHPGNPGSAGNPPDYVVTVGYLSGSFYYVRLMPENM